MWLIDESGVNTHASVCCVLRQQKTERVVSDCKRELFQWEGSHLLTRCVYFIQHVLLIDEHVNSQYISFKWLRCPKRAKWKDCSHVKMITGRALIRESKGKQAGKCVRLKYTAHMATKLDDMWCHLFLPVSVVLHNLRESVWVRKLCVCVHAMHMFHAWSLLTQVKKQASWT